MAPLGWTAHYQDALRSEPENLLERIQIATQSIVSRLYRVAFHETTPNATEYRALCLALSDLRVLRASFVHSRPVQLAAPSSR